MSRVLSLAGFQVTIIGRFWLTAEAIRDVGFEACMGIEELDSRRDALDAVTV
jgi:hypothetical protein